MKMVAYLHNEILIAVKMKGLGSYLAAKHNAYLSFKGTYTTGKYLKGLKINSQNDSWLWGYT